MTFEMSTSYRESWAPPQPQCNIKYWSQVCKGFTVGVLVLDQMFKPSVIWVRIWHRNNTKRIESHFYFIINKKTGIQPQLPNGGM